MARDEILGDRRKALEEEFFRKQDQKLREQLRAKEQQKKLKQALTDASGITREEGLARLIELGISAETVAALTLVPLVEVAWADGKVDDRERKAILRAAEEAEIGKIANGTVAYALLENWLATRPPKSLRLAWEDYVKELCKTLTPEDRIRLERVLDRARDVAVAAGGFLGVGKKISAEEEAVLAELATAIRS